MFDTAFRLAASPLLLAQALRVRRIAQSLPEADGPREGVLGSGPALRLAIIGDSSAAGVGVAQQSQALAGQLTSALATDYTVTWHLDAKAGATTQSTLDRLRDAAAHPLDIVVVALGVNDVTRLIPASLWLRQQRRLLARLSDLYDPQLIYISGMPPLGTFPLLPEPLRWTLGRHAARLERRRVPMLEKDARLRHIPFDLPLETHLMASDGFHPSAALYALWGAGLAERIKADLNRSA